MLCNFYFTLTKSIGLFIAEGNVLLLKGHFSMSEGLSDRVMAEAKEWKRPYTTSQC